MPSRSVKKVFGLLLYGRGHWAGIRAALIPFAVSPVGDIASAIAIDPHEILIRPFRQTNTACHESRSSATRPKSVHHLLIRSPEVIPCSVESAPLGHRQSHSWQRRWRSAAARRRPHCLLPPHRLPLHRLVRPLPPRAPPLPARSKAQ